MKKVIGKIILSDKMIGWSDNVNNIRLTLRNKEETIYEGMNLTLIERAVKEGKITFIKFKNK
jgi:hypothetical protein